MSRFADYSRYYSLLHKDNDYASRDTVFSSADPEILSRDIRMARLKVQK